MDDYKYAHVNIMKINTSYIIVSGQHTCHHPDGDVGMCILLASGFV